MWIRTCRLRSWFSSTVFRTALSEMSRTWEERWQQWFYNAVILEGRWRSRFYPDRDHGNDNTWQWRRLPGRWSPQLYLDDDDNNDNGGNNDDDEDCDDDAYRVSEVLNCILTMMTMMTTMTMVAIMTMMRTAMTTLTGSVKSSILSWQWWQQSQWWRLWGSRWCYSLGRWSPQLYLDQPPRQLTTSRSLPQRRPAVEMSGLVFSKLNIH